MRNLTSCEVACSKGKLEACLQAAHTFDERFETGGEGRWAAAEAAIDHYERACRGGQTEGCWSAVRGVLQGPSALQPDAQLPEGLQDAAGRRRALLELACEQGNRELCREGADASLGMDKAKALRLHRMACEHPGAGAGGACQEGFEERAEQAQWGAAGCEKGVKGACLALGRAVLASDRRRARESFEKECRQRRLVFDGSTTRCVDVYEKAATARELPRGERASGGAPSAPNATILLRSVQLQPARPSQPTAERIRAHLDRGAQEMRPCYVAGLVKNRKLQGELSLTFWIDGLGDVWDLREQDVGLVDVAVVQCALRQLTALQFPAPGRDLVEVKVTFAFRSGR